MPRQKQRGGSGKSHSTQDYVTKSGVVKYGRAAKGRILTKDELVDYFAGKEIECLECGNWYKGLSGHLVKGHHDLTKEDYCIKYGIPVYMALVAEYTSQKMSISGKEKIDEEFMRRSKIAMAAGHSTAREKLKQEVSVECPECGCTHKANALGAQHKRGLVKCKKCALEASRASSKKNMQKTRGIGVIGKFTKRLTCSYCKEEFNTNNNNAQKRSAMGKRVFCSNKCVGDSNKVEEKKTHHKVCLGCSKEFNTRQKSKKFCTKPCYDSSDIGRKEAQRRGKLGGEKRANGKREANGRFGK